MPILQLIWSYCELVLSRIQTRPLAFFHLHYFSPPGRPAQRLAAAGIHRCPRYLQAWRLSRHPTHTVKEKGKEGREKEK